MKIHPKLDRKYTVRELLRLQGLDDNFTFDDNITKQKQYLMVGNAIPPTITKHIFENIVKALDNYKEN